MANFLACQHLTRLDLLKARGVLDPPYAFDVGFQDLVARGEAHERTVLDQFRAEGLEITEIRADRKPTLRRRRWRLSAAVPM